VKVIPFLGGGTAGKSRTVTAQRKLNIYLEHRPDGEKGVMVSIYGTPGLKLKYTVTGAGSIRGMTGTNTNLYLVSNNTFYKLDTSGTVVYSAPDEVLSVGSTVEISSSTTQTLIADGVAGYLYDGSDFTLLPDSFPHTANTVTFVAGYFVAEEPNSQKFWVSDLYDGSTWNGLAFASASQYPDNILAVDNLNGILIPFCEQHMEFWQNVGSTPVPFAPILSATNDWGLAALHSRSHIAQSICFLGRSEGGQIQICRLMGYTVTVISTSDIDAIINGFTVTSDAVGLSYQVDAHPFYQITFPTADRSFLYDCSTGIWSETQSGHALGYATRHLAQFSTLVGGQTVFCDISSNNIYTMDGEQFTDNGLPIERELITRHALDNYNEFTVDELYLDMETGVGVSGISFYDEVYLLSDETSVSTSYASTNVMEFTIDASSATDEAGYYGYGYALDDTYIGSFGTISDGNIYGNPIAGLYNDSSGGSILTLEGFASNPTSAYIYSVTCNGITVLASSAIYSWQYETPTSGTWIWSGTTFGMVAGGIYTATITLTNGLSVSAIYTDITATSGSIWNSISVGDSVTGNSIASGTTVSSKGTDALGRYYVVLSISPTANMQDEIVEFSSGEPAYVLSEDGSYMLVDEVATPGADPRVMLSVSRDNGKTYETEQWVPVGKQGQYMTRVLWRRQGSSRVFTFKIRYTEPTKFVIANAAMSVREAPQ
jgi:hypothetical protein